MVSLVVPLVGTGNVPQLAVDLLLHSVDSFQFVCAVDQQYLYPFAGPLDHVMGENAKLYPKEHYSAALELFISKDQKTYVLQQRTPVIPGYMNNFVVEVLIPLIQKYEVDELVVLDSFGALDMEAIAPSPATGSFFSVGTCQLDSITDLVQTFQQNLSINNDSQKINPFNFDKDGLQQEISTDQDIFKIVYHIINATSTTSSGLKKLTYCSTFVHEGDNSEDAYVFYNHLMVRLPEYFPKIENFRAPVSWKGVYGFSQAPTAFDEGIYA
ncbi:hypothetical protein RNJ44_00353 [Nakaseomyces bracarensis]|uniref:Proteasome assembly chaperone 2 n=1 Tax=Nakaseomyces bracarensis TaxID=273131 RepID=A0ABR4NSB2_9SACH